MPDRRSRLCAVLQRLPRAAPASPPAAAPSEPQPATSVEIQKQPWDSLAAATAYAALLSLWDREADRFWVRNNLLLIVNGALLGFLAQDKVDKTITFGLAIFGLFVSYMWLMMNRKGGYYVSRWRPAIEDFEQVMLESGTFPALPLTAVRKDAEVFTHKARAHHLIKIARGTHTPKLDAGDIMHIIILGFCGAWLFILAAAGLGQIGAGTSTTPRTPTTTVASRKVQPLPACAPETKATRFP